MTALTDLKHNLAESMTMAAFAGISFYICLELQIRLFLLFKRRRGLYFWSCALCSWGVGIQTLTIMMSDFGVWKDLYTGVVLIYLSWLIMIIPQSLVLFSRLHLVVRNERYLRWVLYMIIFNSIVFTIPTIVLGVLVQTSPSHAYLRPANQTWTRIPILIFFLQETVISTLYIYETYRKLRTHSFPSTTSSDSPSNRRDILRHLIYTNLLIIALDASLLGVQYANYFYVMGAYKPCVYGIKLRVEFAILNRLIKSLKGSEARGSNGSYPRRSRMIGSAEADGPGVGLQERQGENKVVREDSATASLEIVDEYGHGCRGIVMTTEVDVEAGQRDERAMGKRSDWNGGIAF